MREPTLIAELRSGVPLNDNPNLANEWGPEAVSAWDALCAALPALLEAVVGEMKRSARGMVLVPGYWSDGEGTVADPAALLAALTTAARRVGG